MHCCKFDVSMQIVLFIGNFKQMMHCCNKLFSNNHCPPLEPT
jgi:hypothetical protein